MGLESFEALGLELVLGRRGDRTRFDQAQARGVLYWTVRNLICCA